jgi:hypothetical protein
VRRLLRGLDVDAPHVRVYGRLHARVGRYPATYRTQAGPVEVERSLYREVGVHNGPTVDAVSLRSGSVETGWLPETAKAMAYLVGCGTSREAEGTSRALHRLPQPQQLRKCSPSPVVTGGPPDGARRTDSAPG